MSSSGDDRVLTEPGAVVLTGREAWAMRSYVRAMLRDAGARESRGEIDRDDHLFAAVTKVVAGATTWDTWHRTVSASGNAETTLGGDQAQCPPEQALTTEEVAAMMTITPRRVRQLADTGDLPATRNGRAWHFDPRDVHHAIAERSTDGRH